MSAPPSPNKNTEKPDDNSNNSNNGSDDHHSSEEASGPKARRVRQPREAPVPYTREQDLAMRWFRDDLESDWNTVLRMYQTLSMAMGWPVRTIAGLQSRYYREIARQTGKPVKEIKAMNKGKNTKGNKAWGVSTMHPGVWYQWMGGCDPNPGATIEWDDESYDGYDYDDHEESEDADSSEAGPSHSRHEGSESGKLVLLYRDVRRLQAPMLTYHSL
jgi:hypothetical protein